MISAGMACIGFIGPAFFDLAPPKYFASQPLVVERAGGAPDSSASSMKFFKPSTPVLEKMAEQPKNSETSSKGLTSDLDVGGSKRQTDPPDIAKKRTDIIQSDDPVGGKMVQLSKPVKPVTPSKNSKGSKALNFR